MTKRILHVLRRLVLSATQRRPVVTDDPDLRLPAESDSYDLIAINEDGSFYGRSHGAFLCRPVVTDDPGLRLPTESNSYDRSYDLIAINEDGSFFGSRAFEARSHDAAIALAGIYAGTWQKSVRLYWTPPASPSAEGVYPRQPELISDLPMPIRIPMVS